MFTNLTKKTKSKKFNIEKGLYQTRKILDIIKTDSISKKMNSNDLIYSVSANNGNIEILAVSEAMKRRSSSSNAYLPYLSEKLIRNIIFNQFGEIENRFLLNIEGHNYLPDYEIFIKEKTMQQVIYRWFFNLTKNGQCLWDTDQNLCYDILIKELLYLNNLILKSKN